jgi:hypothetical protein
MEVQVNPVIQLLPVSFGRDDFRYSLVKREGLLAIYHQTKAGYARGNYEVVRIQVNPAARIFGIDYPAREALPSSEQWGTDGFTYYDLSDAETRFNRMTRAAKAKALLPVTNGAQ